MKNKKRFLVLLAVGQLLFLASCAPKAIGCYGYDKDVNQQKVEDKKDNFGYQINVTRSS